MVTLTQKHAWLGLALYFAVSELWPAAPSRMLLREYDNLQLTLTTHRASLMALNDIKAINARHFISPNHNQTHLMHRITQATLNDINANPLCSDDYDINTMPLIQYMLFGDGLHAIQARCHAAYLISITSLRITSSMAFNGQLSAQELRYNLDVLKTTIRPAIEEAQNNCGADDVCMKKQLRPVYRHYFSRQYTI